MQSFHDSLTQKDAAGRVYNLDEFAVTKLLVNGERPGANDFFDKFNELF